MWNMQSGIKRKGFNVGPCPPEVASRSQSSGSKKRERCITGLATDSLNRTVVASTLDGTINVGELFVSIGLRLTSRNLQYWTVLRLSDDEIGAHADPTFIRCITFTP
jgi:hypothetical protein